MRLLLEKPTGQDTTDVACAGARTARAARGVALELEIQAPLPVRGSPEHLGRAIYNPVHNDIKYTPSGGHTEPEYAG